MHIWISKHKTIIKCKFKIRNRKSYKMSQDAQYCPKNRYANVYSILIINMMEIYKNIILMVMHIAQNTLPEIFK